MIRLGDAYLLKIYGRVSSVRGKAVALSCQAFSGQEVYAHKLLFLSRGEFRGV